MIGSLTGLASGETEPTGRALALVITAIAACTLALAELGIAGIVLVRGLFQRS